METKRRLPELLIPAGNPEKMRAAILYGADAVYIGLAGLSLRSSAAEMSLGDIAASVAYAHAKGVKVYAAANTFARNSDIMPAKKLILDIAETGIDGLIVSDPGIIRLIRNLKPNLSLHLSTQANTMNMEAVRFWAEQGIKRIVLARELNLTEISKIAAAVPEIELEIFIHGAMCISYSGRCYLSAYFNQRSANQGACSQPCRWEYLLTEATRPHNPLILEKDEKFSYLLSSKDLCLIEHLPEVYACGVSSVKIEGRMKSSYYVAVVTRAYRQALDALDTQKDNYVFNPQWLEELKKISHRGYTTGFAFSNEKINETSPERKIIQTHEPAGIVIDYNTSKRMMQVEARNHLRAGEILELMLPNETITIDTRLLVDFQGNEIKHASAGKHIYLPLPFQAPNGALLRRAIN